jgi:hypothetical protein
MGKIKIDEETLIIWFIYAIITFAIIILLVLVKSALLPAIVNSYNDNSHHAPGENTQDHEHKFGLGGFTKYDLQLARELMDPDGDGICDVCEIDIDTCIESGQLQCNMGETPNNLGIGILDLTKQKAHFHADLQAYTNGVPIDFNNPQYFVMSRFLHMENSIPFEQTLHMHATNVPLWIFFDSIELELPSNIKAYVNGNEIQDYRNYIFNDGDKILITDGKGNLHEELESLENEEEHEEH